MSVKFTGINLSGLEFGPELGDRFGTTYFANPKSAFDYWDSNGANTVRLPFLWERLFLFNQVQVCYTKYDSAHE